MSQQFRYPSAPADTAGRRGAVPWTMLVLVVMNLLPVVGVLLGDLTLGDVFIVYWVENVVVGALTVVRILTARDSPPAGATTSPATSSTTSPVGRWFLAPFFVLHYGLFTLVHGVFTGVLVGLVGGLDELSAGAILGGAVALTASHLVSLVWNWFREDERSRVSPSQAMGAPYPRMVVLHLAVIGSFFLLFAALGSGSGDPFEGAAGSAGSVGPVVLLCGLKTALDGWLHVKQHRARQQHPHPLPEVPRNI